MLLRERSKVSKSVAGVVAGALLLVSTACTMIGSDPTQAGLEGVGEFSVATIVGSGPGFNSGTVYYPIDVGTPVGVVVASPGFSNFESVLAWMGPRIASHGFAVMTIENFDRFADSPVDRGDQLVAARNWLRASANTPGDPLAGIIDPDRVAYSGFSMGGGGALLAAQADQSALAVLALAPYLEGRSIAGVTAPSLVIGCELDQFAPIATEVLPTYESLNVEKTLIEIGGANHSCPVNEATPHLGLIGRFMISWMKYFVDGDPRYEPFVCGSNLVDSSVSDYRNTCPVS